MRIVAACACALLATVACAMGPQEVRYEEGRKAQTTADGLHLIHTRGAANRVFVKPATDLSVYTAVMLEPVRVRYGQRSVRHLSNHRTEQVETRFRDAFLKELGKSQVYRIVDAPGPDVLRIAPQIVGLEISAPEEPVAGTRKTVVVDRTARMTLLLDISDSRTHDPLVRVAAHQTLQNPTGAAYATSVTQDLSDAKMVFRHWAKLLRGWLDDVRTIPPHHPETAAAGARQAP